MLPEWTKILVPVFLACQAAFVFRAAHIEQPPTPPPLSQFPTKLGRWTELHEDPIDPDILNTLRADQLLSRTYRNSRGEQAGFLVAWFQSQRAGASQPHSPKVCLPASGWSPVATGELSIGTSAGPLTANRYVVASRSDRAAILYWYETPRGPVAGEWASKLRLVEGAVRDRRTDTALVRVVVETRPGGEEGATATAVDFTRAIYPKLREILPR